MKFSIEVLQSTINASALLSQAEKQEWLHSLEFMNDKQLADLYAVLGGGITTQQPSQPKPAPSVAGQGASLQTMLHTAEARRTVPPPIPQRQSVSPAPKPVPPKTSQWRSNLDHILSEKELPAGEEHVLLTDDRLLRRSDALPPRNDKTGSGSISMSALLDATAPVRTSVPQQSIQHANTEKQVVTNEQVLPISSLPDVSAINIASLTKFGVPGLMAKLVPIIQAHSYFEVLLYLEKSPLYIAYVDTGKELLTNNGSFEALNKDNKQSINRYVTKAQFEAITDLLRKIKG